jgi:hypothetical protein
MNGGPFAVSGLHFFTEEQIPFFDLNTDNMQIGQIQGQLNASVSAPENGPRGQNGERPVNWLRLLARDGESTGNLKEIFRVGTAGRSPPENCEGMAESFEVQYAAQ